MFFHGYFSFLIPAFICMMLSAIASSRVHSTYAKFDKVRCRSGITGYDTACRLLRINGVSDISVGRVKGKLTDHYHPKKAVVNLSEATYDSNSVAAVAVAAHEIGHVIQRQSGYPLYRLRTVIVPVVNFGSWLAMPLVLVGLMLDLYARASDPDLGFKIAMVGVILYGGSLLFALVTLPVELNASRRAKEMLIQERILTEEEMVGAKKVLSAAAFTYLASLITSIIYFLRFLFMVLSIFGRRSNR